MENKKASLTAPERETIITFDDEGNECQIYTCSRPVMTKLDKLCKSSPEHYKLKKRDEYSKTYTTDKRLLSFRSERQKRTLTEEQRRANIERLKKARESKA
jgi:hypothetical protein